MSNPPNPLSIYRTYSYHHVLVVCDSTQTATEIADSGILSEFFLNRPPEDKLVSQQTPRGGAYVVLISGFTDAQFVIQDIKWSTIIASNTPTSDGGPLTSTVETDGEMTILEPQGVRFLNVLANVCDALQTDPTGLVFLLKTFFVGNTDTDQQDLITNIRPFLFCPCDIQAKFDETGALYTFGFVGLSNGAAKLPYINEIANSITIAPTERNQTLEYIFNTYLPKFLKNEYNADYQKLMNDYNNAGIATNKNFRQVTYKFDLDPAYRGMKFGTNEITQTSNEPDSPILAFSSSPTMEQVINGIMLSSADVVAEVNNETDKYIYKITSSIDSTPTDYVVTFHIHRYHQVNVPVENTIDRPFVPEPGNVIEFDYIFSGKNTDIKDFDIRMSYGLAFFHTITTSPNLMGQTQSMATSQYDANGVGGAPANSQARATTDANTERRKSVAFVGGQQGTALTRNKFNPINTANFQSVLARYAALENVQVKMTIAGNPQLLDEMSALPRDFVKRETESPKAGQTIAPRWMTVPAYVKVNIFMPSTVPGQDFVDRFWYDGYYQMLAVDNIFSEGAFTQEIEMFSLPYGSILDKRSDQTTPPTNENIVSSVTTPPPASNENAPGNVPTEGLTAAQRTEIRNRQKGNR
jgi:hypothetical protein